MLTRSEHLRDKYRFERYVGTDDGYGNLVGAWEPLFTAPARLVPDDGRETVIASGVTAIQPLRLFIRSSQAANDLRASDRAVDAMTGEIFNLREKPRVTRDRAFMQVKVEAGVAT